MDCYILFSFMIQCHYREMNIIMTSALLAKIETFVFYVIHRLILNIRNITFKNVYHNCDFQGYWGIILDNINIFGGIS